MRVAVFSAKSYDIEYLGAAAAGRHELEFLERERDRRTRHLSDRVVRDDVIARLLTLPNVLVTGHQAFFSPRSQWQT